MPAKPALKLGDILDRANGDRFAFPPLRVVAARPRQVNLHRAQMEVTVWDYDFEIEGDHTGWKVRYSGHYHHSWDRGRVVQLKATLKSVEGRWRCINITRPLQLESGAVPLFA